MASLPSIRVSHRPQRDDLAPAEEPLPVDLEAVSMTRAAQAARRLREEDRARLATSVPPPPARRRDRA